MRCAYVALIVLATVSSMVCYKIVIQRSLVVYLTIIRRRRSEYVWVIDQVWGQDGWILAEFFFCVFIDRDGVKVHKQAKKELGQYQAILTEQAWSIKDLLYGFRGNFSCGTRWVVPSGQDSSILPARVANHSAGFNSSCPYNKTNRSKDQAPCKQDQTVI